MSNPHNQDQFLRETIDRYKAVIETTTEGYLMLDLHGNMVLANKPADQFLGLFSGREIDDIYTTQTAAIETLNIASTKLIKKLVHMHRGVIPDSTSEIIEIPNPLNSTRPRFVERFESPVLGSNGQPIGWLIGLRDVTDQQEKSNWQFEMTNMIVHDLRNPITVMLTTLEWLKATMPTSDSLELVQNGIDVGKHMLEMINSVMDIAKMEANRLELEAEFIDTFSLVRKVIQDTNPYAVAKEVELINGLENDWKHPGWGDPVLVRRILINLIDNAIKYTPRDGEITINAQPLPGDETYLHWIELSITDQGPGILDSEKERIFERYAQTKDKSRRKQGTGLGLTFCKMAIEAQGGSIGVRDNPDGGSIFYVRIPGLPRKLADEMENQERRPEKLLLN